MGGSVAMGVGCCAGPAGLQPTDWPQTGSGVCVAVAVGAGVCVAVASCAGGHAFRLQ